MNKYFVFTIAIVTFLIMLCIYIFEGGAMNFAEKKSHNDVFTAYRVNKIIDNVFLLQSGNKIYLIGVDKRSFSPEAINFMDKIHKVVVISSGGENYLPRNKTSSLNAYVYILGVKKEMFPVAVSSDEPESRAFLNIKDGLNMIKGIIPCLNTLLIKAGYAKVDREVDFEHKDYFITLEQEARDKKLGIWK